MKNIIRIISKFILVIVFFNIFAFSVKHVYTGGTRLGIFTNALIKFSEFPTLIKDVFREFISPSRFVNIDVNFHPMNHLKYDIFALNAHYDNSKQIINLSNLKNDSIICRWYLNEKDYINTANIAFSNAFPVSPVLLEDKSVITYSGENLYKLDKQSKIIWVNTDYIFHHSLELDKEGNLWVPTQKIIELSKEKDAIYQEDYITKIDIENGNTLYHKSIRDIFIDNGMAYLVYGITNRDGLNINDLHDPFHLNDIEPVLENGPYWNSGDLFLSLRNRSMILLFRPSTNKILQIIQGPFFNQHDVDIQSDSTISLFNNNRSYLFQPSSENLAVAELQHGTIPTFNKSSHVLLYNFRDSTFAKIYSGQFDANKIYTETQGQHHILSNGDMFVESTDEGKVYILNENEVLLRKYLNPVIDNQVEPPHWVRIFENINF